jgi:alpha-glucosidase
MENARATYEGLLRLQPNRRPFVMTRAAYAGTQKYALTWTGDNSATWDHLKLMVHQLVNLGLSGFTFSGADIGGFTGGPDAELLTRFHQYGAFTPVFRNHSAKDTPRVEPWVDGAEHLAIRRRFIQERYRLMPYLYGVAEEAARTGDPFMRPVFYDHPTITTAYCDQSMSFTVGRDLLIAGAPRPESPQPYDVCLPEGGWYDYWTGRKVTGKKPDATSKFEVIKETPRLEHLPVFVRAGSIVPRQIPAPSTSQGSIGPLELAIYPGPDCRGEIYTDDGESLDYKRGKFLRQQVRCTSSPQGLTLDFGRRQGTFAAPWRDIRVTVHDWQGDGEVRLNERKVAREADFTNRTLRFTVPDPASSTRILVRRS